MVRSAGIECGRLLAPQILEEQTDGLDAAMEVGNVELLVGSVQVVIRKAESHHHAGNLKHVLKVSDDRNEAAGATEDSLFLKDVAPSLGSGRNVAIVGA